MTVTRDCRNYVIKGYTCFRRNEETVKVRRESVENVCMCNFPGVGNRSLKQDRKAFYANAQIQISREKFSHSNGYVQNFRSSPGNEMK